MQKANATTADLHALRDEYTHTIEPTCALAAETLTVLKSRMHIRPVRNTSLLAIRTYAENPEEAAKLANEIAQVYGNHSSDGPFRVEIVDRAAPALRPSRPNRPLSLAIGGLLGLGLATVAGVARASYRAKNVQG